MNRQSLVKTTYIYKRVLKVNFQIKRKVHQCLIYLVLFFF